VTLILATVSLGSSEWTALSASRHGCNTTLRLAYDRHCDNEFIFAESAAMDDAIDADDVTYMDIELGEALRDGSRVPRHE
jgi:hypothetical protein